MLCLRFKANMLSLTKIYQRSNIAGKFFSFRTVRKVQLIHESGNYIFFLHSSRLNYHLPFSISTQDSFDIADLVLLMSNMNPVEMSQPATSLNVAHWLEHPTGLRKVMGIVLVGDSVLFSTSTHFSISINFNLLPVSMSKLRVRPNKKIQDSCFQSLNVATGITGLKQVPGCLTSSTGSWV